MMCRHDRLNKNSSKLTNFLYQNISSTNIVIVRMQARSGPNGIEKDMSSNEISESEFDSEGMSFFFFK